MCVLNEKEMEHEIGTIESVELDNFSYTICSRCNRKPGSNAVTCADCRQFAENGGQAQMLIHTIKRAFALRVVVSIEDICYRAVLFDSAAKKLLGISADDLEFIVSATECMNNGEEKCMLDCDSVDWMQLVARSIRGTVVTCTLDRKGNMNTDLAMKV